MMVLTGLLLLMPMASGWDRQKAFEYLESRQQQWANWKPAQKPGGPCISCHTGLSYLLARRVAGDKQTRPLEAELIKGVETRVVSHPPKAMLADTGAEAILNLLALSLKRRNPSEPPTEAERAALKRLWEMQINEGEAKGSWTWFMHELHPVESEHSTYYGAALAALALSAYPAADPERMALLVGYLKREAAKQPLHNRLAWIAFRRDKDKRAKAEVLAALWGAQSEDGGWSAAALGPWAAHPEAPPDSGSNAYATAWAAYTAREAGVSCGNANLKRALDWLEKRQDPSTGAWNAVSMNKVFPAGSMQLRFMSDAATGFAAAALMGCGRQ